MTRVECDFCGQTRGPAETYQQAMVPKADKAVLLDLCAECAYQFRLAVQQVKKDRGGGEL